MIDPLLAVACAYFLAAFFFIAAAHKAHGYQRFVESVESYGVLPRTLLAPVSTILITCESMVGASLLFGATMRVGAAGALLLLSSYTLAIGIRLVRNQTGRPCGCSFLFRPTRLTRWHLLRNGVLLMVPCFALLPTATRSVQWLDYVQASMFAAAAFVMYLMFEALASYRDAHRQRQIAHE